MNGQEAHDTQIISHWENANQNRKETPVTPTEMVTVKETDVSKGYEPVRKLESSYAAGENVNWCDHFGKEVGNSSES